MKNDDPLEQNDLDELLRTLALLRVVAPETTVDRIRKRVQIFQLSRDLLEKQVFGFWIALHGLLTVLFRYLSTSAETRKTRRIR